MPEGLEVGAALRGVHLTLPLACNAGRSEVMLEAAHGEWLFRHAAHRAVQDGLLGFGEAVSARFVAGRVRDRHAHALCLGTVVVELTDTSGRVVAHQEIGSEAFSTFAEARGVHLWLAAGGKEGTSIGRIDYSIHATDESAEAFPVIVPMLPRIAVDDLALQAFDVQNPDRTWVATFVVPEVLAGFAELEATTRTSGLEAAGRIHTRLGFDADRRCFVRVLERVIASTGVTATASAVVSTPASWGEYLQSVPTDAPMTPSQVHTHPHLPRPDLPRPDLPRPDLPRPADATAASGEESALGTDAEPVISVQDRVTQLTTFPNTLSVSIILSVYEDRTIVSLYGYGPDGLLREEPGWFRLRHEEVH